MMDFINLNMLKGYIQYAVVTLLFVGLVPWGRSFWLKAELTITILFASVCIFVPDMFLKTQTLGDLDAVHIHMYRCFGILLLGSSLNFLFTFKSPDLAVTTTYLWARVICTFIMHPVSNMLYVAGDSGHVVSAYVMSRCYAYSYFAKSLPMWNSQSLYFAIYGDCLWLLGNLIYALKSTDWRGQTEKSSVTTLLLRLDFLVVLTVGILWYCLPEWLLLFQTNLKQLDYVHISITRAFGAMLIGHGIVSGRAVNFSQEQDKLMIFISRILQNSLILTAQIYTQVTSPYWSFWHACFAMMGTSLWSVNAALAIYFNKKKTKQE